MSGIKRHFLIRKADSRGCKMRSLTSALTLTAFLATSAWGATRATFENGGVDDTFVTLQQFGAAPGPGFAGPDETGGPGMTGNYLMLSDAVGDQHNWATFDLPEEDEGEFPAATFSFDFVMDTTATPGQSADGFSFSFYNTDLYGFSDEISGTPHPAEDPRAAGVLGFGFDTWNNVTEEDAGPAVFGLEPDAELTNEQRTDYQEMSVYYDGTRIARIDDTRTLDPPLVLDDGDLSAGTGIHTVTGWVDFEGAQVHLEVDGNPIFNRLEVPGLVPFESRIAFATRTGGEWSVHGIDNLLVKFGDASIIPNPDPPSCVPLNDLEGDLDGNGTVEFGDFLILSGNFGNMVAYEEGDVDCNGTVEFADFLALSGNFGNSLPVGATSAPEPSSAALIAFGCGLLGLVRRKRLIR